MTAPNPRRARLAARLRAVRATAFSSGNKFATAIGRPQSRVSKLETGVQLPTEKDIREWVTATGAGDAVEAELMELVAAARIEYATHRDAARYSGGFANMQAQVAASEAQATHIAEWQPAMIPGLLQTAAYARELLALSFTVSDKEEIEATVAGRVKRQEILYQTGRRIRFVIGEAALRGAPGTIDTLLGQLDRLTSVAGLATVELGVVPFPAMPIMPLSSFMLRDDLAIMETNSGEQQLYEPDEVALYVNAFERLRDAAATGPDAVALIHRVAAALR
ncbi:MAG: DUF5753 domain-containing protein [Actinomycetota bacterium]|nr:DUF5753 domain-containing protein [Actinomycetota bacterium]